MRTRRETRRRSTTPPPWRRSRTSNASPLPLAFLRAIEADAGVARDVRVVAVEALSALVAVGKTTARVGWGVGRGGGASGGMGCAFAEGSREDDGARAEAEDEASEAARVGDVEAFRDALMKAGAGA